MIIFSPFFDIICHMWRFPGPGLNATAAIWMAAVTKLEMPWLWWNWRCRCSCQPRPQQGQIRAASGTCSISEGNPGSRDCTCLLSYTGQVHSNVATTGMPAGSFFLTMSFSVLGISPVIFSMSSEFSLGRLYFAREVSISSRKSVFLA